MQGNYGTRFLDMYRTGQVMPDGTDVGLRNAQEQWCRKLAGFADCPERIARALEQLPPHPPTLPEFLALCRQQPGDLQQGLPAPRPDSAAVKGVLEAAARAVMGPKKGDRDWAKTLRAEYLRSPRSLYPIQVLLASSLLGEVWEKGRCRAADRAEDAA